MWYLSSFKSSVDLGFMANIKYLMVVLPDIHG